MSLDDKELQQYDRAIHTFGYAFLCYYLQAFPPFCFPFYACSSKSLDAVKKLTTGSCLISGMNGAGVEIGFFATLLIHLFFFHKLNSLIPTVAKNIILSGVHSVTIHDTITAKIEDLSTQVCALLFPLV